MVRWSFFLAIFMAIGFHGNKIRANDDAMCQELRDKIELQYTHRQKILRARKDWVLTKMSRAAQVREFVEQSMTESFLNGINQFLRDRARTAKKSSIKERGVSFYAIQSADLADFAPMELFFDSAGIDPLTFGFETDLSYPKGEKVFLWVDLYFHMGRDDSLKLQVNYGSYQLYSEDSVFNPLEQGEYDNGEVTLSFVLGDQNTVAQDWSDREEQHFAKVLNTDVAPFRSFLASALPDTCDLWLARQ